MHKIRLLVIAMFMMTLVGGATVAGFGTAGASAAAHRTCSQSVKPGWHRPSGIVVTWSVVISTDTCGRWMRAAERCKYPGAFGGYTYKWHVDPKPKRIRGQKTSAYCGTLGVKATNWGYQFYVKGSGKGHGWQLRQLGHSTSDVAAHTTALFTQRRHVRTQVSKNGCHYSGKSVNLGVHTSHMVITKDSCGRDMRAFAYCTTLVLGSDYAVGPWRNGRNAVGKESTATCPHLDDGVYYSGYRYVYYKCIYEMNPTPHCYNKREVGTYGLQGSP